MPSYDYKCNFCNQSFTIEKSMTDLFIPNFPKCNSSNVSKIWGGFQLKGCCSKGSGSSSVGGCGSCSVKSCSTCR